MGLARLGFAVVIALFAASQAQSQDEPAFPTETEVKLLLTQADRAMQQYKLLIDQEEIQFGKGKAEVEAVAKDRDVVKSIEMAVQVLTFDMQAKCAKDAKAWFNENWRGDKDTILLTYTNHYNKSQNKCFILVEYHYSMFSAVWTNNMSLWDIYENEKYGDFSLTTTSYYKPTFRTGESIYLRSVRQEMHNNRTDLTASCNPI